MIEGFDDFVAFAAVAEAGSFVAASGMLERDASVISRRVSQLEKRLGVRLLVRTTRSVTLTEAGTYFLRRVRSALDELAAAKREVGHFASTPQGVLKISLPVTYGRVVIAPLLADFLNAYPEIRIDAHYLDRAVDVVAEGFDAVIRVGLMRDSSLIGRKVGSFRSLLVATPEYLRAHGRPESPQALSAHVCLCFTAHPDWPNWILERGPERVIVQPRGRLVANTSESLLPAVVQGGGVALLPDWMVAAYLRDGRLEHLLPEWRSAAEVEVRTLMPPGALVPAKTRVFVDMVTRALSSPDSIGNASAHGHESPSI